MRIVEKIRSCLSKELCENIFVRFISSFIFAVSFGALSNKYGTDSVDYFTVSSVLFVVLITILAFVLITFLFFPVRKNENLKNFDSIVLLFSMLFYSFICVSNDINFYFALGMSIPTVLCSVYCFKKNENLFFGKDVKAKIARKTVIAFSVVSLLVLLSIGVFRYLSYSAPNYDFGVFVQSCYNLKTKFIDYNTCERDNLMPHMKIHISPVLYLTIPFYSIFRTPAILPIIQAVVLISSVIPLYLICKHNGLSNKTTIFVCFLFGFYPALTSGTFYDFHENVFLLPFLLWMIYFSEKEKCVLMYLFVILTLTVKEDATIYIAFFGIYLLFYKKKRLHGLIMTIVSIAYLGLCIFLLNKYGMGAMTNRFEDYILNEDLGLLSVVLVAVQNPAYIISNLITAEKLVFILEILLPIGFLPFITKKFSRYILIGPFIIMNLMPSYEFQHSINFQYVYGFMAFFFYLTILNIKDMTFESKKKIASALCVVSIVFYSGLVIPKIYYVGKYFNNREDYKKINSAISLIPEDASVISSTFILPHVAERDEVYEIEYTTHDADYIVLDLRMDSGKEKEDEIDKSEYKCIKKYDNLIAIYKVNE